MGIVGIYATRFRFLSPVHNDPCNGFGVIVYCITNTANVALDYLRRKSNASLMDKFRANIFICYRREDSQGSSGRLYDRLRLEFENVFFDVGSGSLGEDFLRDIANALNSSDVFLAVIGRHWLNSSNGEGRRIDNANDLVRIEIKAAIRKELRMIPVLVDNASMPKPSSLPRELNPLALKNAIAIRHESFDVDSELLISTIKDLVKQQELIQGRRDKRLKYKDIQRYSERHETAWEYVNNKIDLIVYVLFFVLLGIYLANYFGIFF